ncbi:MAG TPA: flagellar biosynthesis protein FlhB [Phycisphaerae bacterium]|nr:flagellar biosynthesis protein FlhB [Phycisphaerae bacterium]
MASEGGDRTEAPTPRRRQEARQRGQVARSTDLSAAIVLLGTMLALRWFAPTILQTLYEMMTQHLSGQASGGSTHIDVMTVLAGLGMTLLTATGPLLLGVMMLGALSNFLQVGFLASTESMAPDLNKLNPIAGFSRLLSTRTLVQLAMNLIKLVLVSSVAWVACRNRMSQIMLALDVGGWQQLLILARVVYDVGLELAIVLLLIGLTDYAWQRWKLEKDLRMTKEEVKEEMRRMEGDPIVKQRRRKMQFVAIMQQIRKNVPKADVVVTNPTEYAVAIQYDSKQMAAPKVTAKGQDYLAQKIREVAMVHGVPIVERREIAQALYKTVDVGQEIPERLYQAIAEILAYVYELTGKAPKRTAAA